MGQESSEAVVTWGEVEEMLYFRKMGNVMVLEGWKAWGEGTGHWLFSGEMQKLWEGLGSTTASDGSI